MHKKRVVMSKHELRWIIKQSRIVFLPLLLIIMISAATSLFGVTFALISRDVIDTAIDNNLSALFLKCIIMLAVVLLQISLQSLESIVSNRATIQLDHQLKIYLYELVLKKDWRQISTYHSGDLVSRITSDISHMVNGVLGIIPGFISLVTQLLSALYVLLILDPIFALIILLASPIVVIFGNYYSKKVKKLHVVCQESESISRSFLQESLQNLMLTKAFSIERYNTNRYKLTLEKNKDFQLKRNLFGVFFGIGLSLSFWICYIFAIVWGSYRLNGGQITFGTMTAFLQLANQIQSPLAGLTRSFPRFYTTLASAGRLIKIEEISEEVPAIPINQFTRKIDKLSFVNTSFAYADERVLDHITFDLNKGEFAILEGASGEGKSTILKILLGLIQPSSGEVYLTDTNGNHIKIDNNTRSFFTYVPQGNSVFSGTIEENIRFGISDAEPKEIWDCIKAACLDDFIMELPDKLQTVIGERGAGVSEGQAQRIAIARALLRKAPILLLDEATSALDQKTEEKLLNNLRCHAHDRICIFVSHRKSINKRCDKVFLLNNGTLCDISHKSFFTTSC